MPAYLSENGGPNVKTITLVLSRIRQYAVKNKIVFILFIIGGVLNSVIFIYLYGNLRPVMRNYNSTDYYYRRYEVIFSWQDMEAPDGSIGGCIIISPDKNYITEEDIDKLIDTGLFESIVLESHYQEREINASYVHVEDLKEYKETQEIFNRIKAGEIPDYYDDSPPHYDENGNFVWGKDWDMHVYEGYLQPTGYMSTLEGVFRSLNGYPDPIPNPDASADTASNEPLPESICACVYGKAEHIMIHTGSGEFTSKNQAVMSNSSMANVGGTVSIRGEEFEVIGRSADVIDSYLIPIEKYKELSPDNNHMFLISKDRWHEKNDVPLKTLIEMFSEAKIRSPIYESYDQEFSDRTLPRIIVCFAITMIAFAFLLDYLTSLLSDENAVSIIVGGRPSDITAMSILEGTVLSLITIAAGLVIHFVFYDSLFSKLNTTEINYRSGDYLEVFLIMAVLSIIIMCIRSFKYLKLTPHELRNGDR